MKNSAFILWLEGVDPEVLSLVPAVEKLAKSGVDIQLVPSPLVEKSVCYYQTLTGMGSGKIGRFDALRPEGYKAVEDTGIPDGSLGHLLPDVLRTRKLAVSFIEAKDKDALDALAGQTNDCSIVRLNAANVTSEEIDSIVQCCIELAGPTAHMIILTDVWSQAPNKLVNINDFLAEVGLLEAGTSRRREDIIWSETLAYGLGTGQIWINLRGRETQGCVGPGREYQDVCDALINELLTNWLDPQTQKTVVEQVLKKENAFTGEYLFKAPDLIVVYCSGYASSPKAAVLDFDGVSIKEVKTEADVATPYARLIASGPSLHGGFNEKAALIDIMPTIMYLFGQPIPEYVDGGVISSIFTQAYRQETRIERSDNNDATLSDEDEGLIVDRLRALGYLG